MERRKKRRKLDANSYDKSWDRIQLTGAWAPQEGSLTAQNYREMERQKDKQVFLYAVKSKSLLVISTFHSSGQI